jgi:hypothetical protein
MTNRRIRRTEITGTFDDGRHQFTLQHLLGLTVISGVLLTIAREIIFKAPPTVRWGDFAMLSVSSIVSALLLLPALLLSSLVFSSCACTWRHAAYVAAACVVSLIVMFALALIVPQSISTCADQLVSMELGAIVAGMLTAWPLRVSGYRFAKHPGGAGPKLVYLSQEQL